MEPGGRHAQGRSCTTPTKVGTDTWLGVTAGSDDSCALKSDNTMWCAGFGFSGPMEEQTTASWTALAQPVNGETYYGLQAGKLYDWSWIDSVTQSGTITDWSTVAPGSSHFCGIRADGSLWCQGDNTYGELGDGTRTYRSGPVEVGTAKDWTAITAGSYFTCGLRTGGNLYCWGNNANGQIGDGTAWSTSPVPVQ